MSTEEVVTTLAEELRHIYINAEHETWETLARHILETHTRKGTPIAWDDVRVGDTIRWERGRGSALEIIEATVTRIDGGMFVREGHVAFCWRNWPNLQLFLIHRPSLEPAQENHDEH